MISEHIIFSTEGCKKCTLNGKVKVPWEVNNKLPEKFKSLSEVPICHIVFVGEAPGHMEEKNGAPFVHKAGALLRATIRKIREEYKELDIFNIMITNACKCKPTNGTDIRPPRINEIECCRPNLKKDLELAKPIIIVALGKIAATALEVPDATKKIDTIRGKIHKTKYGNVIVTYHPSAILRQRLKNIKTFESDILNAFRYAHSKWITQHSNPENTINKNQRKYVIITQTIADNKTLISEFQKLKDTLKPDRTPGFLKFTAFDYETTPIHWEYIPQFDKHLTSTTLSPHLGDIAYAGISYIDTITETDNKITIKSFSFPVKAKSYAKSLLELVTKKRERLENDIKLITQKVTEIAKDYNDRKINSVMLSLYFLYSEYGINEKEIKKKFAELIESETNLNTLETKIIKQLNKYVQEYKNFELLLTECIHELDKNFSVDETLAESLLKDYLSTKHFLHIACNAQFELAFTKRKLGIEFENGIRGTEILDYLLGFESHSLSELEKRYLHELILKNLIENYTKKTTSKEKGKESIIDFMTYNAEDAAKTLLIYLQEIKETTKYKNVVLSNSYKNNISLPQAIKAASRFISGIIIPAAVNFHLEGINFDLEKCKAFAEKANNYIKELIKKVEAIIPGTQSVRDDKFRHSFWALYEKDPIITPKDGKPSLSENALKTAYHTTKNEVFKKIILYVHSIHKYESLLTKYIENYPFFINPATKRIHPWYNTTKTSSGRIACEKPNLQQVPREPFKSCPKCYIVPIENTDSCPICGKKLEVLLDFREVFIPEKNHLLAMADYSQIEMAILAELSNDEKLISAINNGLDMHSYNASNVYGIPYEEIKAKKETDENIKRLRQNAKKVTFAVIYGATDEGIAAREGIAKEEAAKIINTFFSMHPKTKKWIERRHIEALNYHVVLVPTGRPRWFPTTEDPAQINEIKRKAQNTPIQGFASDINLVTCELLRRNGIKVIGAIHDSIIAEIPEDKKEEFEEIFSKMVEKTIKLKDTLKDFFKLQHVPDILENLRVKLKAEAKIGKSWKEVK